MSGLCSLSSFIEFLNIFGFVLGSPRGYKSNDQFATNIGFARGFSISLDIFYRQEPDLFFIEYQPKRTFLCVDFQRSL